MIRTTGGNAGPVGTDLHRVDTRNLVSNRLFRVLAAACAAGAVLFGSMATASGHVTVASSDAAPGGYAVITFRVPNERAGASTTGVTVSLPPDTPPASVSVLAQPGWTFTTPEKALPDPLTTDDGQVTEAVTGITWTATAGGIRPGEFGEFTLEAGPLPNADTVTFTAIQTYDDGSQVAWIEVPAAGGSAEPEHPAPVLQLRATATEAAATGTSGVSVAARNGGSDRGLAITGVALGGVGALLGGGALAVTLRRRSQPVNDS